MSMVSDDAPVTTGNLLAELIEQGIELDETKAALRDAHRLVMQLILAAGGSIAVSREVLVRMPQVPESAVLASRQDPATDSIILTVAGSEHEAKVEAEARHVAEVSAELNRRLAAE